MVHRKSYRKSDDFGSRSQMGLNSVVIDKCNNVSGKYSVE